MCEKALISRDLWSFKGGIPMLIILSNAVKSRVLAYVRSEPLISLGFRGFGKTLYTTFTQVLALFSYRFTVKGF